MYNYDRDESLHAFHRSYCLRHCTQYSGSLCIFHKPPNLKCRYATLIYCEVPCTRIIRRNPSKGSVISGSNPIKMFCEAELYLINDNQYYA